MERNGFKMTSIVRGLLIIAAGVLLYLFNIGVLPIEYKHIVFSWPMLLAAIGFSMFFSARSWVGGLVMMLVGGFFLLQRMHIEGLSFITNNGWAIILVVAGFALVWKAIMGRRWRHHWEYDNKEWKEGMRHCHANKHRQYGSDEPGFIERNYIFGGSTEKLDIPDLKGGEISCVFGGIELDIVDCQLADGVNILEINTVFGGVVIYAPIEWNIQIQQNAVFGQFADHRPHPDFVINNPKVLIIKAASVFGGGEIKCRNQK